MASYNTDPIFNQQDVRTSSSTNPVSDITASFIDMGGIGSGISQGLGKILGTDNNDAINSAIASISAIQDKANAVSGQNKQIYRDYLNQMQGTYGAGAENYNTYIDKLAKAIDERGDFGYDKTVDTFLDPARDMRQKAAAQQLNASASTGGNRFSSNYQDKLMAQSQAMASEEWQKAFDRMMQDRQQQLAEWQTGQNKINNLNMLTQLYGQDRNQLTNALGDYYSNMANQNNADLEVYSDIGQKTAELNANRKSGVGSVLGGIGSVIGAIFG